MLIPNAEHLLVDGLTPPISRNLSEWLPMHQPKYIDPGLTYSMLTYVDTNDLYSHPFW